MTYIVCAGGLFSRCLHSVCQTCGGRNEVHAMGLGMLDSHVQNFPRIGWRETFQESLIFGGYKPQFPCKMLISASTNPLSLRMSSSKGARLQMRWCVLRQAHDNGKHGAVLNGKAADQGMTFTAPQKLGQKDATSVYKRGNMVTHFHAVVVDDEMMMKWLQTLNGNLCTSKIHQV